jgi:cytochrome c biogenesis protein CcmG/thiol:disulfide interchange protein DsbE
VPAELEDGTRPAARAAGQRTGAAALNRSPLRYAGRAGALGLAALFVGLLVFGLLSRAADTTIDDALSQGRPSPPPGFNLALLSRGKPPAALAPRLRAALADRRVDLRELRGAPVVVNFWASWCVPCREEATLLERGWRRHGPRGVVFLGLNMQDITEDARGFLAAFGQTFPSVRDPDRSTATAWGVTGIPETFFIDRGGRVVGHVVGVVADDQLDQGVASAQAGQVITRRRGGAQRPTR